LASQNPQLQLPRNPIRLQVRIKKKTPLKNIAPLHCRGRRFHGFLTLALAPQLKQVQFDDFRRELQLALSADARLEQIRDSVHAWLQSQAKRFFAARLKVISDQSGRQFSKFSLSNARGRWGSCSEDGHIRLNWRLIHFGQDVIDYVIAHELAHTHTMDHSASFWDEVAEILPNFEEGPAHLLAESLIAHEAPQSHEAP